ncbi:SCP-2 sterol transfer family protein [Acinetobacter sp.]|uniref:SCP-2 sterol transfer family protein n=1 Tax=Acinetobacter sp. TaxID=472 RepID=UPI00388D3AAE
MKFPKLPVVKLPLVDVSTDPLDLLVSGLVLRMKQLARSNPKFIDLIQERQFRLEIATQQGMVRQIVVDHGSVSTVSGRQAAADFVLEFENSEQAVKTLIKGDTSAIMSGVQNGSIKMEGDFSLLVWLSRSAQLVVPKQVKTKVKQVRRLIQQKMGR